MAENTKKLENEIKELNGMLKVAEDALNDVMKASYLQSLDKRVESSEFSVHEHYRKIAMDSLYAISFRKLANKAFPDWTDEDEHKWDGVKV
jgi:hypothetical protein